MARRRPLASVLFAVIRPRDAKGAKVTSTTLRVRFAFRTREIPLGDVETAELKAGWWWGTVRVRHASGQAAVSGLSRADATALATALEAARIDWWRKALATRIAKLRSVHERVVQLAEPNGYIARNVFGSLVRDARDSAGEMGSGWPDSLSNAPEIRMLNTIQELVRQPEAFRVRANEAFVENELGRSRAFLDRVEAHPLTDEQRRAVVVNEDRNLVVAAAGSGKTSVIVAKAGWLARRGYRHPSELLLLAFARDARNELQERIRRHLGDEVANGVTIRTFHSLGMSIIGRAEGRRPSLAREAEDSRALFDLLKGIVASLIADRDRSASVLKWFQGQFAPYRNEQECRNWGEYWDYIRRYDIRSLRGEKVKSYEECEIANFLYLNGVPYEYEANYEYDAATPEKRQYRPDFHLTEARIYIEHFGLDARGRTAPFVDREEYLKGMEWKRQLHQEKGTVLIETFSHQHASGTLIDKLARGLSAHGVVLSPIPREEVFAVLAGRGRVDPFVRLVATFLHHFKGAQLSLREAAQRAKRRGDRQRARAFLTVFGPILERYQKTLRDRGEIDFHDMIGKATEHVEAGHYRSPFGYILVDEFQDISPARARLLRALLDQTPGAQLFAVGDDWQSIYRFGGADIAVMREFAERFGHSERMDLETTFRCSEPIAAVATRFILGNPAQIRKKVRSTRHLEGPCVHIGLSGLQDLALLSDALGRIAADAAAYEEPSSVLLLGRYKHMRPANLPGLANRYPRLGLTFMTVHGSKGLQADYVVVLGLCAGRHGFPTEIADDPLLDLVLAAPENHPNAEERRLFYVALTRARRHVFVLAEGGPPSPFVLELIEGNYDVDVFGRLPERDVPCPTCVRGHLVRRENARNRGAFYGCSNWPYCEHTQAPCPACGRGLLVEAGSAFRCRDCGQRIEACPDCDGWLRIRMGRYGRFFACSNYPTCNYTRNVARRQRNRGRSVGATPLS
ncbi:MAG: UvrD-helicase domain-containing protein [Bryobacterales bacterium]|nr:UvrD-helicase domain-containing protein [Bryobacterales bacterium]